MARIPAYQRIYSDLMNKIKEGFYPIGSFLPPEPQLESIYNVSRITIRNAISMLSSSGYIYVQQGSGTKVIASNPIYTSTPFHKFHNVKRISDTFSDSSIGHTVEVVALDSVKPDEDVAKVLNMSTTDFVYRLIRIIYMDSVPFGIMTTYLKPDPLVGFEDHKGNFLDLYVFLAEKYNLFFVEGDEHITAVTATSFEAPFLRIETGAPLLCFKRISKFTGCGTLEYLTTKLRPDIYQLSIHMEGSPTV